MSLTSLALKAKVVRLGDGWQVSADQQPPWTVCCQNDPTTEQPYQQTPTSSTTLSNKRRQWRTHAEHCRLKGGPPLMRRPDIHKNSPVYVTKQTLGLRVGFINSHLTANKLFPVNLKAITGPPKMSLLLDTISMPAFIIEPRAYPCYAHGWPWLEHNVQPAGTDVISKPQQDCQPVKCYSRADPCIAPQTVFQFTWCLRKTFLLTHKTARAIKMYIYVI